jgi:hypothetical protein
MSGNKSTGKDFIARKPVIMVIKTIQVMKIGRFIERLAKEKPCLDSLLICFSRE